MVADVATVARIALALVLLAAAAAKLLDSLSGPTAAAAFAEAMLAIVLLAHVYSMEVAVVALGLFLAYSAHAFRSTQTNCHCFGARLPSTSPLGQRIRNLALLTLAALYFAITAFSSSGADAGSIGPAVGVAILAAIALITLPWLLDWALADPTSATWRAIKGRSWQ